MAEDLLAGTRFRRLVHVTTCASTQDLALRDPEGGCAVYWADHQTSGRGRQGRSWHDQAGQDLAVTMRLQAEPLPPARMAAAVPAATAELLQEVLDGERGGLQVGLDWPNDVVVAGRKLAGILIDSVGPRPVFAIGIGLNVNRTSFPAELSDLATSLALLLGRELARDQLVARLARAVDRAAAELETGDVTRLADAFARRLGWVGTRRQFEVGGSVVAGTVRAVDLDRALLDDGRSITLATVQAVRA